MRKFTYDMYDRIKQPTFVLSSAAHHHYGVINNIDPQSVSFSFNMNGAQEGSFEVYKYMNGELCPLWDKIRSFRYVYVPEHEEYYELEVSTSEGDTTVKQCTLTSASEYELSNKTITSLEINTDSDFNYQEYISEGGIKTTEYSLSVFCRPNTENEPHNEDFSIVHRVLHDKCPDWTVRHCDATIANEWGEFSISNQNVYDVLTNTLAKEFDCLFQFDSVNREIYIYDLLNKCNYCGARGDFVGTCPDCEHSDITYGYGNDSNIYISYNNYSEKMTVDGDEGNVKNCFYVTGGDDYFNDIVRSCNPTRSNYIYNFSAMDYDDMPSDLVTALNAYNNLVKEKQPIYDEVLGNYYEALNNKYWYEYSMMPRTGLTRWQPDTAYSQDVAQFIFVKTLPTWAYLECVSGGISGMEEFDATTVYEGQIINDNGVQWAVRRIQFQEGRAADQEEVIRDYLFGRWVMFMGSTLPGLDEHREINVASTLTINNAIKNLAKIAVGSLFKIDIITDDPQYFTPYVTPDDYWMGNIKITNTSDKTDVHVMTIDTNLSYLYAVTGYADEEYSNYLKYWQQQVESRMAKDENTYTEIFDYDNINDFKAELKKYSLSRLQSFANTYSAGLEVLSSNGVNDPTKPYLGKYNLYTPMYAPLLEKYDAINDEINRPLFTYYNCTSAADTPSVVTGGTLVASESTMNKTYLVSASANVYAQYITKKIDGTPVTYSWESVGNTHIQEDGKPDPVQSGRYWLVKYYDNDTDLPENTGEPGVIQKCLDEMDAIAEELDLKIFLDNEDPNYWNIFHAYLKEGAYNNSNYISGDRSDGAILNDAKKLLHIADIELRKATTLQYTLSDTIKNLLNTEEFKPFKDKFELGDYLFCEADDKLYKLRLIQVKYDYGSPDGLAVTFSNVTRIEGYFSDVQSVLNQAQSMGTTYQTTVHQVEKNSTTTTTVDDWLKEGLNTAVAKIKNNNMEEVTMDNRGVISRQYNDITEAYDDKQVRLTHNALEFTEDNWRTASLALGEFTYKKFNEATNEFEDTAGYGLISDFMSAGTIIGSDIIAGDIYSSNYKYENGVYTGAHLDLHDGNFVLANGKLQWDNSKLTVKGRIETIEGTIGGWNIGANSISNTNSSGNFVSLGNGTNANQDVLVVRTGTSGSYQYPFYVRADGTLVAAKATITGNITATSGVIGGWNIGTNELYINNNTYNYRVSIANGTDSMRDVFVVRTGTSGSYQYPFFIRATGEIYASLGTVGGWSINSESIYKQISDTNRSVIKPGDIYLRQYDAITHITPGDISIMSEDHTSQLTFSNGALKVSELFGNRSITIGRFTFRGDQHWGVLCKNGNNECAMIADSGYVYSEDGTIRRS